VVIGHPFGGLIAQKLLAGGMVPEVVARAAYQLYAGSGAVTDYHAFPGRGHSLVLDHGWREIADCTLSWLARQDLQPVR
jgi:hypothetical protein